MALGKVHRYDSRNPSNLDGVCAVSHLDMSVQPSSSHFTDIRRYDCDCEETLAFLFVEFYFFGLMVSEKACCFEIRVDAISIDACFCLI